MVHYLGRLPYAVAWQMQRDLAARRKAGEIPDTLLLLEHDAVITLGRNGGRESLLLDEGQLAARGVTLVQSDRGGDATYHGPGQVVGYPIFDLRPDWQDLRRYVRALEQAMIDTVAEYGVEAGRLEGAPGAWLPDPDRKIGAIGVRVSRWVTHHGFALNVNTRLEHFGFIIPCGLRDKGVTSLKAELGHPVPMAEVMEKLAGHLARLFGRDLTDAPGIGSP